MISEPHRCVNHTVNPLCLVRDLFNYERLASSRLRCQLIRRRGHFQPSGDLVTFTPSSLTAEREDAADDWELFQLCSTRARTKTQDFILNSFSCDVRTTGGPSPGSSALTRHTSQTPVTAHATPVKALSLRDPNTTPHRHKPGLINCTRNNK